MANAHKSKYPGSCNAYIQRSFNDNFEYSVVIKNDENGLLNLKFIIFLNFLLLDYS